MRNMRAQQWWKRAPRAMLVCGALAACTTSTAQPAPSVQPVVNVTPLPEQDTAATAAALQEEAIPTPVPRDYIVQEGDTLSAIAVRFGTTVDDILALNTIADPNALQVGQTLLLPGGPLPTPAPVDPAVPLTDTGTIITPDPNTTATPPEGAP